MAAKFNSVMDPEDSKTSQLPQTRWPQIPKIPEIPQDNNDFKKHFEPRKISMGPYHHNNHELKAAEMLKVPIDQTVHPKQWPGDSRFVQQDFKGDLGTKRLLHNRI